MSQFEPEKREFNRTQFELTADLREVGSESAPVKVDVADISLSGARFDGAIPQIESGQLETRLSGTEIWIPTEVVEQGSGFIRGKFVITDQMLSDLTSQSPNYSALLLGATIPL